MAMAERRMKLFRLGRNQAVRIPRGFELPGAEAIIRKDGERLIVEPAPKKSLLALLATLEPIEEHFPPIDDRPPEPVDLTPLTRPNRRRRAAAPRRAGRGPA
jgi:antitoxin VapB